MTKCPDISFAFIWLIDIAPSLIEFPVFSKTGKASSETNKIKRPHALLKFLGPKHKPFVGAGVTGDLIRFYNQNFWAH